MLLAVAEQCAQALDRARLYRAERGIAETLQLSLLPAQLPALERLALAAHYLPAPRAARPAGAGTKSSSWPTTGSRSPSATSVARARPPARARDSWAARS